MLVKYSEYNLRHFAARDSPRTIYLAARALDERPDRLSFASACSETILPSHKKIFPFRIASSLSLSRLFYSGVLSSVLL